MTTRAQRLALAALYRRHDLGVSYLQFRRGAFLAVRGECLMVRWCGMLVGIETDGYTHT